MLSVEGIASSFMEMWPEFCRKLIELSKLESSSRPLIRKVLAKLEESDNTSKYNNHC